MTLDGEHLDAARHRLRDNPDEADALIAQLEPATLAAARLALLGEWVSVERVERLVRRLAEDNSLDEDGLVRRLDELCQAVAAGRYDTRRGDDQA